MRKMLSMFADAPCRLMAAATVAFTFAETTAAHAGSFGDAAVVVNQSFGSMGKMVLGGSMVAGLGLSGAGLLKLKAAADSGGQQVKYSEGLWRIGVGAGLVALPTIITTTLTTGGMANGGGTVTEGTASFR